MSDLDVRSLGMVASRMLTNYIKSKEKEGYEKGDMGSEDEEYFDPNYLEVRSRVLETTLSPSPRFTSVLFVSSVPLEPL